MASIPVNGTERPLENSETPHTSDGSGIGYSPNVQYNDRIDNRIEEEPRQKMSRKRKLWHQFRDGQKTQWWFASTAIPLLAATLGPLANVLSIAALVSYWRATIYVDGEYVPDFDGIPFSDPRWCYWLNVGSLICGFLGNLFLLFNFTQRIRYLIALPATIILWYLATGFLIGITACMQIYAPPNRPYETYTQGYWYAVSAAAFYMICSMILMVNMLGYFLGQYPDTFALNDAQRTLILQTMLFFIWLAGGAAIFSKIEQDAGETGWAFSDALYFCDVTILTVGFGDLYPTNDLARGLVFPYSVGGIIMLGLVISSIYKFMKQMGEENIIQNHVRRMRERTISRTVTSSFDLRDRDSEHHLKHHNLRNRKISGPIDTRHYHSTIGHTLHRVTSMNALPIPDAMRPFARARKPRLILMREEKDRFDAMRMIQRSTRKFKKWTALTFSVIAFGILWCVGAVVFWRCERKAQGMTYFQALYFCYISLLTIGYGDLAPKSNAGRCFFVVWSLIAVPTMTILVSDMGDTVVDKFKRWSNDLADFTVLPKYGIWRAFLEKHPWLLNWVQKKQEERLAKKRLKTGFETTDPDAEDCPPIFDENDHDPDDATMAGAVPGTPLSSLAAEAEMDAAGRAPTTYSLSRGIAASIKRVATDMQNPTPKRYEYEEWVEFTRLIRWSSRGVHEESVLQEEDDEGLIEWDWIGEDSPLLSGMSESHWLLNKLCEALVRVERRKQAKSRVDSVRGKADSIRTKPRDDRLHDLEEEGHVGNGDITEEKSETVEGTKIDVASRDSDRTEDAQNRELASGADGREHIRTV